LPEISLAEDAPGQLVSRLDPRTKLLALLVLNAFVMRASPTSTLLAVQLLAVVALAWEVSVTTAVRTGLGCLLCDAFSLGSPLLVAWLEGMGSPRGVVLVIGTCSAIAFWFARFFAGFSLALYVYRTTRIGQMKAALRAVHLPRVFVDALAVAFRVIPTVGAEAGAIRGAGGWRESLPGENVFPRALGIFALQPVIPSRTILNESWEPLPHADLFPHALGIRTPPVMPNNTGPPTTLTSPQKTSLQ